MSNSMMVIAILFIFYVYCEAADECKDTYPNCKEDKVNCSSPLAAAACARTCGLCGCKDEYEKCKDDKIDCSSPLAEKVCAKTCGFCGTTTPTIATTTPSTTAEPCVDKYPNVCPEYVKDNCTNPLAQLACSLSCGFCTTAPPECLDRWTNCTALAALGACDAKTGLAFQNCYMTCTNCTVVPITTASPKSAVHPYPWLSVAGCILYFAAAKLFL